jgi:hypothetical protein
MAGGAETPNIAALPAIARLGACESARGPDADRHVKLLIQFAVEGSLSGAYSQATLTTARRGLCSEALQVDYFPFAFSPTNIDDNDTFKALQRPNNRAALMRFCPASHF